MDDDTITLRDLDAPFVPHSSAAKPPAVIQAQPLPAAAAATLKSVALAHFAALEAPMRVLAERYRNVAFDVSTTKGLTAARAARNELREQGRYAVQRAEKAVKDEVNDLKRAIAPKVEALVAIIQPVEDHVHGQIEARERQLEAEREERLRLDAERIARHRANIATIVGYREQAVGKTSEQIDNAIAMIEARVKVGPEYEEFEQEAQAALLATMSALRTAFDATLAREQEAARLEAQRVEQARIAAEQAERQRVLDEQAAELKRQQEAIAAQARVAALAEQQRKEAIEREAAKAARLAELNRINAEAEALGVRLPSGDDPEAAVNIALVEAVSAHFPQVATPEGDKGPAYTQPGTHSAPAAPAAPAATMTLGQICERLGFTDWAKLLADMGFKGRTEGAITRYNASDFKSICGMLADHCYEVGEAS